MKLPQKTKETQYQSHVDLKDKYGLSQLGIEKNAAWRTDPRRILFCLARYKFVAKMLSGMDRVLEIGCGDGWPTPIVLQEVNQLHGVDFDPIFIDDMIQRIDPSLAYSFSVHDMLTGPLGPAYDAVYSLDVLEHIRPGKDERLFLRNLRDSLTVHGVAIIGMPSLQSQRFASPGSKIGHVNCKEAGDLKKLLLDYFEHVFIFSMNDEIVHTGFYAMAQYFFALCTGVKQSK
jgi:SAM-dependent methyltransferase